jgi:hypothetical protein
VISLALRLLRTHALPMGFGGRTVPRLPIPLSQCL